MDRIRRKFLKSVAVMCGAMDSRAASTEWDLCVIGGTAGGVMTAVAASRRGLRVLVVEEQAHLGGMTSSGLSNTDIGRPASVGGLAADFYSHLGRAYGVRTQYLFEPKVAERTLERMLREFRVEVWRGVRLDSDGAVSKVDGQIVVLRLSDGREVKAKYFADCTYTGDLLHQAGVSYVIGREAREEFGENLAGFRGFAANHQFEDGVNGLWPSGDPVPGLTGRGGSDRRVGEGDALVQAYNYRFCLSRDPANSRPFPVPEDYDESRYELLVRQIKKFMDNRGRTPRLGEVFVIAPIAGQKADFNNRGPFSTNLIGASWEYPEASPARRREIELRHRNHALGLFHFLTNSTVVPAALREEMSAWGLPLDEFTDSENIPFQIYVREARRLRGQYVVRQADLQEETQKRDVVAYGSYASDSHHVQRILLEDGSVKNEGNMEVPVQPYQIPYRCMLPQAHECVNLIIPICLSATHVAYSSMRMEPVFMMMGHAAGLAAAQCLDRGLASFGEVNVSELQSTLREEGAVLEFAINVAAVGLNGGPSGRVVGGSLFEIRGRNLTDYLSESYTVPWRKNLTNVIVTFDGEPAPLRRAGFESILGLVPNGIGGAVEVRVEVNGLFSDVVVVERVERLVCIVQDQAGFAVILDARGVALANGQPVRPGQRIWIQLTGISSWVASSGAILLPDEVFSVAGQATEILDAKREPELPGVVLALIVVPQLTAGRHVMAMRVGAHVSSSAAIISA